MPMRCSAPHHHDKPYLLSARKHSLYQRRAPFICDATLRSQMTSPIFFARGSARKSETGTIYLRCYAPQPNDKPYFLRTKKHSVNQRRAPCRCDAPLRSQMTSHLARRNIICVIRVICVNLSVCSICTKNQNPRNLREPYQEALNLSKVNLNLRI